MNRKINLPPDLQKWARKRSIGRIVTAVLLYAATGTVIFYLESIMDGRGRIGIKLFFQCLALVPSVYITVSKNLFDRTFCGKIARVSVKTGTVGHPGRATYYNKNTTYLYIAPPEGRLIRCKASETRASRVVPFYTDYKEGQTVFHLAGSKQYVILPSAEDTRVRCPICGRSNAVEDDSCAHCGYSLFK